MDNIKKICIIGGSGSGKTTLSNNLSSELGIPVTHIDGIHHLENWKVRDKEERDRIIYKIIDGTEWITDGTYLSTLEERAKRADLVIFLDYSTIARLWSAILRFLKNHGKEKLDIPGCKEQINLEFLKMVIGFRKEKRPKIMDKLSKINEDKVLIFKNRRQLNKWFQMEFNKKMKL
ncbi:MAG: DNA topology modulation protein FlaR [Clostridia bacterium]|nr:DNA topology modulation protein FlaR [Clostridia bacterium]